MSRSKNPKRTSVKRAYGSAEGPFGFPMPDDLAKLADEALKEQPADVRSAVKTAVDGQDVDGFVRMSVVAKASDLIEGERADVSLITTESVDRDREVVIARGGSFKEFARNPVVTWNHNYSALPLGYSPWQKRSKSDDPKREGWIAKTVYHKKPDDFEGEWFADAVWGLIQAGALRARSIGFIPLSVREPTPDDVRKREDMADVRLIFEKWKAIEYAVTPVQANPDALAQAVARSKSFPAALADDLGICVASNIPSLADLLEDDDIDDGVAEPDEKAASTVTVGKIYTPQDAARKRLRFLREGAELANERLQRNLDRQRGKI